MKPEFDWYKEKVALRSLLGACLRQSITKEETCEALNIQFEASCSVCILKSLGKPFCDCGHECYLKNSFERYIEIANEKGR